MKIGSYIVSANTIIHDIIFSRNKWDELLDRWRESDFRLSFAAWGITPIIWVIRQVLNLFYQFLNVMYSSLSREMEFNADKVAISTTGSDAIISALWKLDFGFENWNRTLSHSHLASQKKMYSKNLYIHNDIGIQKGIEIQESKLNELAEDTRGGKKYFNSSQNSKVNMYASHPPNDAREKNAKTPYIECEVDSRSPWELFNNKEVLQCKMSELIYSVYMEIKPTQYASDIDIQKFISLESQDKDLQNEYSNTFYNRFIHIPDKETLMNSSENSKTITSFKI